MKLKVSKSGLLAILFWVISFILAFKISPDSCYIWLPDSLLVFGFYPLLIGSRARWLWLVFGMGNILIGWMFVMSAVIPDTCFAPYHLIEIKKHLQLYHPYMVWLLTGVLSLLVGIIMLLIAPIYKAIKVIRGRAH